MVNCSFCGYALEKGKGKMLVLKSNTVKYFCSRRCERYWEMGRNPKKMKWTKFHGKEK